ncbi:MAG TPA: TAXI family TRAP transporter solute-binding subunit [Candidatus Dojkabacteria bacterium]|nr:TAXI family TRAP transporter solute-binding subunit [Candidatus Dojkabacteria bacterium]
MNKVNLLAGVAFALAASALYSPAYSADVTLCAGSPGRNYDSVMKGIGIELQNRGHNVTIKNLKGSEDILRQLDAGTCDYGPAQKDIHWKLSKDNAGFAQTVTAMSLLYNEAITMFCSKDSGIDELSDLDENSTVIVDTIGSGSALTWDNLVNIEKEYGNGSSWINAKIEFAPLDEAQAKMSLGEADCAFGVGAVPSNWALTLQENGETLSWVYDKDINDLVVGKSSLYPGIRVARGAYSGKFDTYAVPAILFRSNKKPKNEEIDSLIKRMAPSIGAKYNTVK